jgi:hypothetical protein
MLSTKLPIPVTVCTVCHAYGRNASLINFRCGNIVDDKKCKGALGSALNAEDWEECQSCHATSNNCDSCNGEGWIYIRK